MPNILLLLIKNILTPIHKLFFRISKLGLEAEDNNNNNNLVDTKTILNNKKIKRRQINNLKEKRRKEWENEIIKELKNSEKSEEEKEENFVTIWRLFNLCTNDFVKIQKNKIFGKGEDEDEEGDNKCSTYFLPETVSEDWTGKGQFILKHFKSGKYICFGRKEGLQVRTSLTSTKSSFCHFHERLSPSGHSIFDSTYFNNRSIGFSLSGNPITKRKRRKNKNSQCFLFTKLIIKLNKNEDICNNLNKIKRNRRAEEGNKQQQLREAALKAVLARIEASEENVIEENI
ncbi:unnamed protein product [Meloidogyne enterolobii]|uniref:Uncharacterized protein n=1 Tax=Meloidogyne enterolobii TaxID=390850 RepID=A0ACB0XLI2_MELEN